MIIVLSITTTILAGWFVISAIAINAYQEKTKRRKAIIQEYRRVLRELGTRVHRESAMRNSDPFLEGLQLELGEEMDRLRRKEDEVDD